MPSDEDGFRTNTVKFWLTVLPPVSSAVTSAGETPLLTPTRRTVSPDTLADTRTPARAE